MMLKRTETSIFIAVILISTFIVIYYFENISVIFTLANYKGISYQFQYDSHVLYTDGCKVPKFDPFDPTVIDYYKHIKGDILCKGKTYIRVKNNKVIFDAELIKKDFNSKTFSCTYKAIYRNLKNETLKADDKFAYGEQKVLIFNETLPYEFVKVICKVAENVTHVEFLASTPIKNSDEERSNKNSAKIITPNYLNIIVIGIDSVSKLNFERHFKRTAEYLRQNMSIFEFYGYTKVADNTFPNITPMLTGHFVDHYYTRRNLERYFDDLDFVWKNFSSIGYRTFLAEDAPGMGTYNYLKNGFRDPPTDYFFRPFTLAIEHSSWHNSSNADCFQAKPEIVALYDYLRSFLGTMKDRPYFAFTWAARLTHGKLNKAGYADKPTSELLRDINDMGMLNRSMLIFLSDHGMRFGDIRRTFIGKIEERMPFLFISFPNWFLDARDEIRANLISNRRRLVTPFDLHETFVDIYQMTSGDYSHIRTPYGMSLFKDISPYRNCKSAFILPHWCVCNDYKKLNLNSDMAIGSANALITTLNNITAEHRKVCAGLKLDAILDARINKPEEDMLMYKELKYGEFENTIVFGESTDSYENIMITVRTIPGAAEFESTVRKVKYSYMAFEISRINKYGSQGDCVEDSTLRKYCYCNVN